MYWECWDESSIPGLAQWVEDMALLQLWLGSQLQLRSDPWPGNSVCRRAAKKKNNNNKKGINLNISVITLNVNSLNTPIKRQKLGFLLWHNRISVSAVPGWRFYPGASTVDDGSDVAAAAA